MRKVENKIMLITYADSLGRNLKELEHNVDTYFRDVIGGIHILPFFPASGDRGFAVIHYDEVEPVFGDWEDLDRLGEKYYLMADFMLNHVSIRCEEFQDYMEKGEASAYKDMFIDWDRFWPEGGPTQEQVDAIYMRKAKAPYLSFTRKDGREVHLWNTFGPEQIDIDPYVPSTMAYYEKNLKLLAKHVPLIRFDAFAYASKRPGSSCFFVEPEIWEVLKLGMKPLEGTEATMLPEIHENYKIQLKMQEQGYPVYDFALPLILLHAAMTGHTDRLANWLRICPRNQFTTLDTHDGIGVVDAADLMTDEERDLVRMDVDQISEPIWQYVRRPSMIKMNGKDEVRYQLSSTYYSAMHEKDDAYILARAVQFFTPGIPMVYYVGMLAGVNDFDHVKEDPDPRSSNRHNYTEEEIVEELKRPVVQRLMKLMKFRNTHSAFDGEMELVHDGGVDSDITITWRNGEEFATLWADFKTLEHQISCSDGGKVLQLKF